MKKAIIHFLSLLLVGCASSDETSSSLEACVTSISFNYPERVMEDDFDRFPVVEMEVTLSNTGMTHSKRVYFSERYSADSASHEVGLLYHSYFLPTYVLKRPANEVIPPNTKLNYTFKCYAPDIFTFLDSIYGEESHEINECRIQDLLYELAAAPRLSFKQHSDSEIDELIRPKICQHSVTWWDTIDPSVLHEL